MLATWWAHMYGLSCVLRPTAIRNHAMHALSAKWHASLPSHSSVQSAACMDFHIHNNASPALHMHRGACIIT